MLTNIPSLYPENYYIKWKAFLEAVKQKNTDLKSRKGNHSSGSELHKCHNVPYSSVVNVVFQIKGKISILNALTGYIYFLICQVFII